MRISDWSSDVCSSDLRARGRGRTSARSRRCGTCGSRSACSPAAWAWLGSPPGAPASADAAFHLELDEAAPLDGVLHGQRAGDRLDEAVHHHAHGLLLGEAAAHQVEELLVGDLRHGGLVTDLGVAGTDLHRSEEHTSELQSLMRISYAV